MLRLTDILDKVSAYHSSADLDLIKKAYVFSAKVHKGQLRLSGEPYLTHPMEVANILADLRLDEVTISAGLLHDTLEDTWCTRPELDAAFGEEIASLVEGLTKISKITFFTKQEQEAENFRKMILAMAKDVRIVVIKLADRVHNMRTLEYLPMERQEAVARETLDIYAPLANRLGIGFIKNELEDQALKYLKADIYYDLVKKVAKKRRERENFIEEVKEVISKKIAEAGIRGEVSGRPKHFYGIYKKMEDQKLEFDQVFDLIAFRVIVESVAECYAVLGMIHSLWKPVPGRFKDYVALPKANMYQSLHSTVIGPHGERMEVQIRSYDMHRVAEVGIAAHWMYKEGLEDQGVDKRFSWLRQMVEWQSELKDSSEFLESLKVDLFPGEVYVFTPKGDVREFPAGATPIDFAYSIHTEIGHHCAGAKVNGKLMPLKYQLQTGDTVEIVTSAHQHPSKDWLKIVKTSRARSKIRQWIKVEERERSISLGREICEKEFRKHDLNFGKLYKSGEIEKIASAMSYPSPDDLLAAVGYGKTSGQQILGRLLPPESLKGKERAPRLSLKAKEGAAGAVLIKGVEDVLVRFGKCCSPLAGDRVIGFITRGRGVTIHRVNCPNAMNSDPERKLEVQWKVMDGVRGVAKIVVVSVDKIGLLAAMSAKITAQAANIARAQITTTEDKKAVNTFEVEVDSLDHLQSVMKSLEKVEGVINVKRLPD